MKKIIRLTENDLIKLVKRVIFEQEKPIAYGPTVLQLYCEGGKGLVTPDTMTTLKIEIDKNTNLKYNGKKPGPLKEGYGDGLTIAIKDNSQVLKDYLMVSLGLSFGTIIRNVRKRDGLPLDPEEKREFNTRFNTLRDKFRSNFPGLPAEPTTDDINHIIEDDLPKYNVEQINRLIKNIQNFKSEIVKFVENELKLGNNVSFPSVDNVSLNNLKLNEKVFVSADFSIDKNRIGKTEEENRKKLLDALCSTFKKFINSGGITQNGIVTIPSIEYLITINPQLDTIIRSINKDLNVSGSLTAPIPKLVSDLKLKYDRVLINVTTISPPRVGEPKTIQLG